MFDLVARVAETKRTEGERRQADLKHLSRNRLDVSAQFHFRFQQLIARGSIRRTRQEIELNVLIRSSDLTPLYL